MSQRTDGAMSIISGFSDAYIGKAKLWKTFVYGYLVAAIPITLAANLAKELIIGNTNSNAGYVIFCAGVLYYVWIAVAIWRCAPNSSHKISKIAGRVFSVIIGLQILGVLKALWLLSKAA